LKKYSKSYKKKKEKHINLFI